MSEIPITIKLAVEGFEETEKQLSEIATRLDTIRGKGQPIARTVVPSFQAMSGAAEDTSGALGLMARYFTTMQQKGTVTAEELKGLQEAFKGVSQEAGFTKGQIHYLSRAYAQNTELGNQAAMNFIKQNRSLRELNMTARGYNATLGATGVAIMGFTREIFWASLGIMFATMSFARYRRSVFTVQRSIESLRDITRSYGAAQTDLYYLTLMGAQGTRRYAEAASEAATVNERLIQAEDSLRQAVESEMYARMMLIFGVLPTFFRMGTAVWSLTMKIAESQYLAALSSDAEAKATGLSTLARILGMPALAAWIIAHKTLAATILATASMIGIGIGMFVLYTSTMAAAEAEIAKTRQELERLTKSIGPHSLVGTMKEGRRDVDLFMESLRNVPKEMTSSINIGTNTPQLMTGSLGGGRVTNIGPVTIVATVRNDRDISRIRQAIENLRQRGIQARGGGYEY